MSCRGRLSPRRRSLGAGKVGMSQFGTFGPDRRAQAVRSLVQTVETAFPG